MKAWVIILLVGVGFLLFSGIPQLANIISTGEVRVFPSLGDGVNSDKWDSFVVLPKINSAQTSGEAQASVCTKRTRASSGFYWAVPPSYDPLGCDSLGIQGVKEYAISKGLECGVNTELGGGESCVIWKPSLQPTATPITPVQTQSMDFINSIISFFEGVARWFKSLLGLV